MNIIEANSAEFDKNWMGMSRISSFISMLQFPLDGSLSSLPLG
jgi:hypothetical protein